MTELTGNKGEWSEMYAFLRIISDGRIYGADGDSNKRDDIFYDINRVIRTEDKDTLDYVVSKDGHSAEVRSGSDVLLTVERTEFGKEADNLLETIKASKGPAFPSPGTQQFMSKIRCYKIKAPSADKSDITIEIHDLRTGMDPVLGFSIKSKLGHPSTLLNPGKTTNMLFSLGGPVNRYLTEEGSVTIPGETVVSRKLSDRYSSLIEKGITFDYIGADNETFANNLTMIDSNMEKIVAEMLKLHYIHGISNIENQVTELEKNDPLGFGKAKDQLYRYKIKKFLAAIALGMKPATAWDGTEDANGGYIIVKEDGEVLCYHVYNRNDFEDYLFKNTRLETPSTSRYDFSEIYRGIDGKYFLKLNLQIRFR
ncbi:MAG: HpaII family restriction endonuclease [Candidatus Methanomethylophilaceae archaeon]|nr:HpaII family restriction endonuclease [Candidatus Methanomethylophilaceae archaeon]